MSQYQMDSPKHLLYSQCEFWVCGILAGGGEMESALNREAEHQVASVTATI